MSGLMQLDQMGNVSTAIEVASQVDVNWAYAGAFDGSVKCHGVQMSSGWSALNPRDQEAF